MKFFEILQNKEVNPLDSLHGDFQIKDGPWRHNRRYSLADGNLDLKVRFGFDDANLIDDCPFLAKIGRNTDSNIGAEYIGFAYATPESMDKLKTWAQKFPYAELMIGLDEDGVSTPESEIEVLNNSKS